jgi:CHAT domain-containing protein
MRTLLCVLLLAGLAIGAAPPVRLTPDQVAAFRQALAHYHQAQAQWKAGKHAEAVASMEKARRGVTDIYGERHLAANVVSTWVAHWETERGHLKEAAEHRERMVRTMAALCGEGHWKTVDARVDLSVVMVLQKCSPAQRAARARALGLDGQARALYQKGQVAEAAALLKQALSIRKEVPGEKHPEYARSLHDLAYMYHSMGEHRAALPLSQKAVRIRKEALGEKHPAYASSLNNLATLYYSMGDHKQALPLARQALAIRKEVLGEWHPDYATSLHNLALLYQDMEDYKQALPLFQKALQINKEVLGEKHPHYAMSLSNLAFLYKDMGDLKRALSLSRRAVEITGKVVGEKHTYYANSLNIQAIVYRAMGDDKTALPLFQKARQINKAALGEKHPHYANNLHNLAELYEELEDHKQALPLAEEATTIAASYLRTSAAVQSDRQQFAATRALRIHLHLRLWFGDVDSYRHLLAWKGAVLLRQRQRHLFSALSANPRTREAAQRLQETSRQIAALSASARPAGELLEQLTKQQERLQSQLSELSTEADSAFKASRLTPAALSAALPKGVALVDYFVYVRKHGRYKDGNVICQRHLVAFVSRKGKPTARVDLGDARKVEAVVREWRPALARGLYAMPPGAAMKQLVWSPLEKHLEGARVVLVSPDGALAFVPFCALPGKKEGTYLIEDVALAVVPVPQLLPEMLTPVDKTKRLKPSLLVVGEVDYDRAGADARADKAGARGAPLGVRRAWGKLPATHAESASVSKSFAGLFEGGKVTDLGKNKATKAKVREALAGVRYAHLATHGFFAHQDIKSALGGSTPDFFGREGVTGWHPLLLSGVVLSGANREPKEGEEDGILTALEVSEMQLPKLELVVLSACETGLGKAKRGEGLLGLQRAFAVAGCRSVVSSLWSVHDAATSVLMERFYFHLWEKKLSKLESLRQAQLDVMRHPEWVEEKVRKMRGVAGLRGAGKVSEKIVAGKKQRRSPVAWWAAWQLSGDWR